MYIRDVLFRLWYCHVYCFFRRSSRMSYGGMYSENKIRFASYYEDERKIGRKKHKASSTKG